MSTKKILILGLALTLMSPLASYAKMGGESGGGGDAVIIKAKKAEMLKNLEILKEQSIACKKQYPNL